MAIAAKLYHLEDRRDQRRTVDLDAKMHRPKGPAIDALISDISDFGFGAELDDVLEIGDVVGLELPNLGLIEAVVVRRAGREYGCEFLRPIDDAIVVSANVAQAAGAATPSSATEREPSPFQPPFPEPRIIPLRPWIRLGLIVILSALLWLIVRTLAQPGS